MDQSFPSRWPDLPDTITYEKQLSERFATEAEPEYILRNGNGVQFLIRVYEDNRKEILTYNLVNHSTLRLEPSDPFYPVLTDVYELMGCEYIHSPSDQSIHYRGYEAETNLIWEYTNNCEFNKENPNKFRTESFMEAEPTEEDRNNKGDLLARVVVNNSRSNISVNSSGIDMSETTIEQIFYENIALKQKDGEFIDAYPIPESVLISNTLNEMTNSDRQEVTYIANPIASEVISQNI